MPGCSNAETFLQAVSRGMLGAQEISQTLVKSVAAHLVVAKVHNLHDRPALESGRA